MDNADTADFQRKNRSGNRRSEEGGKNGTHPAEDGNALFLLIELQEVPGIVSEAAADLQSRSLPSGTAAEEMRDHGAEKNNRKKKDIDPAAEQDGINNVIRVFPFCMGELVQSYNDNTANRKKPDQPGIRFTQRRYRGDTFIKYTADNTADQANQNRYP